MQLRGLIKAFVAKPLGRIAFLLFIALAFAGTIIYLGYYIAIPVFLVVGLALPIYAGWTRPRTLVLVGLSALLVAPPIVTVGAVSMLLTPTAPVHGNVYAPFSQSVLQNATVQPFQRTAGGNFTFTVDVNPAFLPAGSQPKVLWLNFILATCPNAVSNNTINCGGLGAYLFHFQNLTYNSSGARQIQVVEKVGGVNIWYWTIGAGFINASGQVNFVFLQPNSGFFLVQGPVTGDYESLYLVALPLVYFSVFALPGLVFFLGALVYIFLKLRQRRRAGGAPAVPAPVGPTGPTETTAPTPSAPSRAELACPKCGAVVYAGESRCWKCGTPLTTLESGPSAAPLPSDKP